MPGDENGGCAVDKPVRQNQRAADSEHEHDGLSAFINHARKIQLALRQFGACAAAGFARGESLFSQAENSNICVGAREPRFFRPARNRGLQITALRKCNAR